MTNVADSCRVFVCDDQPELREALSLVLANMRGFEIVGEAHDGSSCLTGLQDSDPDVLILDIAMPGGGPRLARAARKMGPRLQIVVFSAHRDAHVQAEMRLAGADDYVVKTGRIQPLREALHRAAKTVRENRVASVGTDDAVCFPSPVSADTARDSRFGLAAEPGISPATT